MAFYLGTSFVLTFVKLKISKPNFVSPSKSMDFPIFFISRKLAIRESRELANKNQQMILISLQKL